MQTWFSTETFFLQGAHRRVHAGCPLLVLAPLQRQACKLSGLAIDSLHSALCFTAGEGHAWAALRAPAGAAAVQSPTDGVPAHDLQGDDTADLHHGAATVGARLGAVALSTNAGDTRTGLAATGGMNSACQTSSGAEGEPEG